MTRFTASTHDDDIESKDSGNSERGRRPAGEEEIVDIEVQRMFRNNCKHNTGLVPVRIHENLTVLNCVLCGIEMARWETSFNKFKVHDIEYYENVANDADDDGDDDEEEDDGDDEMDYHSDGGSINSIDSGDVGEEDINNNSNNNKDTLNLENSDAVIIPDPNLRHNNNNNNNSTDQKGRPRFYRRISVRDWTDEEREGMK